MMSVLLVVVELLESSQRCKKEEGIQKRGVLGVEEEEEEAEKEKAQMCR